MKVNQRQLSEIVGVSTVSLTEWQKESPPLPMQEREANGLENVYDTVDVIKWLVARELRKTKAETPQDRLARVKADREELLLAEDQRRLIDESALTPLMDQWISDLTSTLDGIPEQYAVLLERVSDADGRYQLLKQMTGDIRVAMGAYEFGRRMVAPESAPPAAPA